MVPGCRGGVMVPGCQGRVSCDGARVLGKSEL